MTPTVAAKKVEGLAVYGLPQYEYTLEGTTGNLQFCSVVAETMFRQTVAVEAQTRSIAAALKARRRKLDDYGKALAIFADFLPRIKEKKSDSEICIEWDKGGSGYNDFFQKLHDVYGLEIAFSRRERWVPIEPQPPPPAPPVKYVDCFVMTRAALQKGQAKLEDAVDRENNGMQQEMSSLDGFVSKRDKSFATAGKVVSKYNNAADNTIKAFT